MITEMGLQDLKVILNTEAEYKEWFGAFQQGGNDRPHLSPAFLSGMKQLNHLSILRAQANVTEQGLVWLSTRADIL